MPDGKPAGVPCVQLTTDLRCAIFGQDERPQCCSGLQASLEMCGDSRLYAIQWLRQLESATMPSSQ